LVRLHQWLATDLPRLQKLEHGRLEIEQKLRQLLSRLTGDNASQMSEVKAGLEEIRPERIQRLFANLNRYKSIVDQYEQKVTQVTQSVTEFEFRRDRLRDTEVQINLTDLDEGILTTHRLDEQKWRKLSDEIEACKVDHLPELINLENQLPIKLPKLISNELQERLHQLHIDVSKQLETNSRMNASRTRLATIIRSFQEAVIKARTDSGKILHPLAIRPTEVDGKSKPTELCDSVQRDLDNVIKRWTAYRTETMRRLNEAWQQIVTEAKQLEISESVQDTNVYATFLDLQNDVNQIEDELQSLGGQVKQLRNQWTESDDRNFEAPQFTEQNMINVDHIVGSSSIGSMWLARDPVNMMTRLPSEKELVEEAKQNLTRLQSQLTVYQKQAQHWEVRYKNLVGQKALNEELITGLSDVLQNMHILATQELDEPSLGGRGKDNSRETIDKVVSVLRTRYQSAQNEVNDSIQREQTRIAHLSRLMQSVMDLDAWHLEFHALLTRWLKSHSDGLGKPNVEMSHLKFNIAQGQACLQSIQDWSKQLSAVDSSKSTEAFIRTQVNRANQIVSLASSQPDKFQSDLESRGHTAKQVVQDIDQLSEKLSSWQQKFKELKCDSIKLIATASQDYDSLRQIGSQLSSCQDNLEEHSSELRTNRALFDQKRKGWQSIDPATKVQADELEKRFYACEKAAEDLSRSLEQIRTRFVDVNSLIQRSRQWLHEVSEQIPRARDTRSPIRLPPNPLDVSYPSTAVVPPVSQNRTNQHRARSRSPPRSRTPPGRNGTVEPNRTLATPLVRLHRTQHQDRLEWLDQLLVELNSAGTRLIQEAQTRTSRLETELGQFRLEANSVHEEMGRIREEFEQALSYASYMRQEVAETVDALSQFEQGSESWRKWYDGVLTRLRTMAQGSLIGWTGTDIGERGLANVDYATIDLAAPLTDTIQRHQELISQINNGRSELVRLEALSTDLHDRCNEPCAQQRLVQLKSLQDTLMDSCRDLLPKLQAACSEEREFYRDLSELETFLGEKNAQLDSVSSEDTKLNQLEEQNQRIKSTVIELERKQSNLFSLSDKTDRVCRAASVAALAMNNLLLVNQIQSGPDDQTIRTAMISGGLVASSLDVSVHEGVGSKAKRALMDLRERWKSISQRLEELIDRSAQVITQQNRLTEIQDNLSKWLESAERRLERLHHQSVGSGYQFSNGTTVENASATRHLGARSHETMWNQYVEAHKVSAQLYFASSICS
uniref:Dystrophin n=1 Tax=Echinostoma caproni TaxID=27848 RepID=A0A183B3L2_9TREM